MPDLLSEYATRLTMLGRRVSPENLEAISDHMSRMLERWEATMLPHVRSSSGAE